MDRRDAFERLRLWLGISKDELARLVHTGEGVPSESAPQNNESTANPPPEGAPAPDCRLASTRRRGRTSQPDSPASTEQPPPPSGSSRIQWSDQPTYAGDAGSPDNAPADAAPKKKAKTPAKPAAREARVEWGSGEEGAKTGLAALVGMEDAFDHTPLQPGEKVAYCKLDKIAYHLATWRFLQDQNDGRCCICGKRNVVDLLTLPGREEPAAPEYVKVQPVPLLRPGEKAIQLEQVPDFINRAVTVEGFVHEVYQTKSTGTYFVRFEPRNRSVDPPFTGFKLVIWTDYQPAFVLGDVDIRSYRNRTIRVRGVIQNHKTWGMEIIVHSPHMIEIVD